MRSTTGPGRVPAGSSGAMDEPSWGRLACSRQTQARSNPGIPRAAARARRAVSGSGIAHPASGRRAGRSVHDLAGLAWHTRCSARSAMGSLWLDVRYALRMMVKTPALTAVLAITLSLGIGASTTIFSVVNSVVLQPLPYEQPDELVRVYTEFHGKLKLERFWVSVPEFDDLRKECRSCASVGAWTPGTASLTGGDR